MLACGQNTGLPRSSWGLCLPSPCPSQEWSSEGFEALSRLSPSFQEGGEAAAEGSLGGSQAQALLAASLWYVSLGREAWSSSVSLPTTPGHLPNLGSWVLLGFDSGLFVLAPSHTSLRPSSSSPVPWARPGRVQWGNQTCEHLMQEKQGCAILRGETARGCSRDRDKL